MTHSAVWIRLPQLPTKFYDGSLVQKIGGAIGKLLKVDACTSATLKGRYARLCVEVPMDVPVINKIQIGSHTQTITYEGEGLLCKTCGRLGHLQANCQYIPVSKTDAGNSDSSSSIHEPSLNTNHDWKTISFMKKGKPMVSQKDHSVRTEQQSTRTEWPLPEKNSCINVKIFSAEPVSCPTRSGGGDATSASTSPSTILDRTWTERPGGLFYDRYKRGEYNDNPPKPQLPSSAGHRRYEAGDGQLCEPSLDGKHVESSRPSCGTNPLSQHATTLELTTLLQYAIELEPSSPTTILHSPRGLRWQPTFLSMGSNTSSGTRNSKSLSNANGQSPAANMADWERSARGSSEGFLL
ncbi:hypothetical protein KY285_023730 [Solanum tuberosum]|nr:hypothetical protein KY289_024062 [Solanum tuberosum]KAH0675929.1 hypothetical protein KY285_023730 [Solanum tuberosum]